MRIGLVDVDGHNFPNLPLMKISQHHKQKGDDVGWWCALERYDIVYKSKVFDFTPDIEYMPMAEQVIEGGTGYGLENNLPDYIEHITPDYSIYPQYSEAYGFLTRGCPRQCEFCIVSKKEGCKSLKVADLSEFYTGQKQIKLLDPNLLACMERERLLGQLANSKAWVDFTQGLDIRFIDKDVTALLLQCKIKNLHFAWDNAKDDLTDRFIAFKEQSGIDYRKLGVYVLSNFNTTHEEDLYRIETLKRLGYSPYLMVYDKKNAPKQTRELQRYVNNRIIFHTINSFSDYKDNRELFSDKWEIV